MNLYAIILTIVYYYFSLHQFFFPRHPPTCDVNLRTQTATKDNVHKKLFNSMVIYPNPHYLWFGSCIYCYFDMIFIKILIKDKFSKCTWNHPPFSNYNSIDSKCHISFHTSTPFQFQEPWHHLGDFLTHANEIIQFAKDHPCNQRSDFECHHLPCLKVHRMIHHCTCEVFNPMHHDILHNMTWY